MHKPARRSSLPLLLVSLGLCATALPPAAAQFAPAAVGLGVRRGTELLVDARDEGVLWARGADFKAGFDASGAQFVPFLGSDAPRNFPLAFRRLEARVGSERIALAGEVAPQIRGHEVRFERGGLSERYALEPQAVEQSFVFDALPARGELVLELGLETELQARATSAGLEFTNGRGGVRCGRAMAIDARGARCDVACELVDGGLQLRVPAAFVEHAVLPLTIDPVLNTINASSATTDDLAPDVCFEAGSQRYVAVWERAFSATDHDVEVALLDASGTTLLIAALDASTEFWSHPRIADNRASQRCLAVAEVGLPGSGARHVSGRRIDVGPSLLTPLAAFVISGSGTQDRFAPDVGGDPNPSGTTSWCVVWESAISAGDHDIEAQFVANTGALVLPAALVASAGTTHDQLPSISKSCQSAGVWHVAFQRELSPTNHDVFGANLSTAGTQLGSTFPVMTGTSDDTRPCASSENASAYWLVVFEHALGATHDIFGRRMNGAAFGDQVDLTALEEQQVPNLVVRDQIRPSVDCDGDAFAYAYAESLPGGGTTHAVFCATVRVLTVSGVSLYVSEAHQPAGTPSFDAALPRVCARAAGGGSGTQFLELHQETGSPTQFGNILGSLYDAGDFTPYCFPGLNGVLACPCANPPTVAGRGCDNSSGTGGALLFESGTSTLSGDNVQLITSGEKPSATSIVLQGTLTANAVFGQGVRCVGGTLKRLYTRTASGGSIVAPLPGDPSLSARSAALGDPLAAGAQRFYLVYYRDATVLGGCPATSTFNTTNSGALDWRP